MKETRKMPELMTIDTTWAQVRKGDRIVLIENGDEVEHLVDDVNKKQTWAFITIADRNIRPLRKRLDDTVTVGRMQPTEEEKQASRDKFALDTLRDHLRDMLKDTPLKALDAIIAKARDVDPDYAYDVLTSWNLPGVLKTQAVYRQALAIRANVHREGGHVAVEDATLDELVTAYAMWWYSNVDRKMLDDTTDPTSRSTSVISNLLEDINKWAVGRIVYNVRWTGAADMIERRVNELKAKHNS